MPGRRFIETYDNLDQFLGATDWPYLMPIVTDHPSTEDIYESTLYGAYEFFSNGTGPQALVLFGDGCQNDTLDRNCTQVCSDPKLLFRSWESQWTCLMLAALALGTEYMRMNSTISGMIDANVAKLGMDGLDGFKGMDVLNSTFDCASASCNTGESESCNLVYPSSVDFSKGNPLAFSRWYWALWNVCEGSGYSVNVDIAGPGVSDTGMPRFYIPR